jgi:hypothetical protein
MPIASIKGGPKAVIPAPLKHRHGLLAAFAGAALEQLLSTTRVLKALNAPVVEEPNRK